VATDGDLSRARETLILDPEIEVRITSGPYSRVHVQMTCFTDKRYEDREYLYTSWTCTQRQPGDV